MQLMIRSGNPETEVCDALVVLVNADQTLNGRAAKLDVAMGGVMASIHALGDFTGKAKENWMVHASAGLKARRVLLVGTDDGTVEVIENGRLAGGTAIQGLSGMKIRSVVIVLPERAEPQFLQGLVEGLALASYNFYQHKNLGDPEDIIEIITLMAASKEEVHTLQKAFDRGRILSEATNLARDLVNEPPNYLTPTALAERAVQLASTNGMESRVLGPSELAEQGFGALLGVSQGSEEEPRFIVLDHCGKDANAAPLVFVGKGLTFDSGGLSLKTGKGMEDMKIDMGGAAAVLGGMQAISRLDCQQRVVALIPCAENMTGPRAQRPGDVVKSYGGVTIEVLNTDAEGRLVLSDALGYAATLKPSAVIDAATLTGAAVVALGHHAAALMGNNEPLLSAVEAASSMTGERVWRMPLWEVYDTPLESKVADIKNIGDGSAGTIIGGAFLKRFVSYPWAHLDIAGTVWDVKNVNYHPSRATGYGARLFAELAIGWSSS